MSANRKWFEFSGRIFDGGDTTIYPQLVGDVYLWGVKHDDSVSDDRGAVLYMPAGHDNYSRELRELFAKHGYPVDWEYSKETDLLKKVMETIKSNYLIRENEDGDLEFKSKDGKMWLKFTGRVFDGTAQAKKPARVGDVYVWDRTGVNDYNGGCAVLSNPTPIVGGNEGYIYVKTLRDIFAENGFKHEMRFHENPSLAESIGCILEEEYEFTLEGDIRRINPENGFLAFEDLPEIVDIEELGMF